ncbi:MAG: peptidyl-prolyl cis-trans isomerase [Nitrospinota bacterium]
MRLRLLGGGVFLLLMIGGGSPAFSGPASPPASPPPQDKSQVVVAEVNGRKITLAELEERLSQAPPAVRIQIRNNKEQFIEGLVQAELLYQEALRKRLEALPEVERRIGQAKRRILVEEFVRRDVQRPVQLTEKEMRDFFEANRDRFRRKEQVTLSHVVLKTEKEAWDALAEIRRGAPFAQVARARSIFEATKDSGGVMGTASRGEIEKPLEEAAFKLPIGQVSDPIRTAIGFQIIRVSERVAGAEAKFEDVKEDVRQIYTEIRQQDAYKKMIEDLRSKGKVVVHPERFK